MTLPPIPLDMSKIDFTKREAIATAVMLALIGRGSKGSFEDFAHDSVYYADALLYQLAKNDPFACGDAP